mgnify:CR=1 FL=1
MENKKMTYAQALVNAMAVVADEETRARLADLKASLEKKASSKKAKVDNSEFEQKVLDVLAGGSKTPTELVGLIGVQNTQKVASVCKPLIECGRVTKTTKGKKVTYALA